MRSTSTYTDFDRERNERRKRGSMFLQTVGVHPDDVPSHVDIRDADALMKWYYEERDVEKDVADRLAKLERRVTAIEQKLNMATLAETIRNELIKLAARNGGRWFT